MKRNRNYSDPGGICPSAGTDIICSQNCPPVLSVVVCRRKGFLGLWWGSGQRMSDFSLNDGHPGHHILKGSSASFCMFLHGGLRNRGPLILPQIVGLPYNKDPNKVRLKHSTYLCSLTLRDGHLRGGAGRHRSGIRHEATAASVVGRG